MWERIRVWACVWLNGFVYGNSNSYDPVTLPIVYQLTRGIIGADEGCCCGGSLNTMRLESTAAASTNGQRDWGSEGLKCVRHGWGGGAALSTCYKSCKCSLDWEVGKGTEGVDRRRSLHLCFFRPPPPPPPRLCVVSNSVSVFVGGTLGTWPAALLGEADTQSPNVCHTAQPSRAKHSSAYTLGDIKQSCEGFNAVLLSIVFRDGGSLL